MIAAFTNQCPVNRVRHNRTQYQRVINYGVAVTLETISDWLNEHLPPFVERRSRLAIDREEDDSCHVGGDDSEA